MNEDPFDLERFVAAQEATFDTALAVSRPSSRASWAIVGKALSSPGLRGDGPPPARPDMERRPIAVPFDLVRPLVPDRRPGGQQREAWLDPLGHGTEEQRGLPCSQAATRRRR